MEDFEICHNILKSGFLEMDTWNLLWWAIDIVHITLSIPLINTHIRQDETRLLRSDYDSGAMTSQ